MRKSNLFWGFVLVLLGGLLLLENLNLIPRWINVWGIFWPVVLIVLGISMLPQTSRQRSQVGAFTGFGGETLRLPLDGARSARVSIHYGAGQLRLDDQAAPGELVSGTYAGGLEHRLSRDGDMAVLDLRTPSKPMPVALPFDSSSGYHWSLGISREVPLELELELGASRNQIDLRGLQVRSLRLKTGASATEIELPASAGQTYARVESGVSSVRLRVPAGVAARIHSHSGLTGIDIDTQRFPRIDGGYHSPDYDTAANRLDLELETGVGSVSVW